MTPISPQNWFCRFQLIGFVRIEIAPVPEAGADFEQAAELRFAQIFPDLLRAGEEGKLRRAADEAPLLHARVANGAGGLEIDAERLLREQIFAGGEHVEVDLLVQMMRHGDVDDVDLLAAQHFVVVAGGDDDARDAAEPLAHRFLHVADGRELQLRGRVEERAPAADGAGDFAPHEAAADDAETYFFHIEKGIRSPATAGDLRDGKCAPRPGAPRRGRE